MCTDGCIHCNGKLGGAYHLFTCIYIYVYIYVDRQIDRATWAFQRKSWYGHVCIDDFRHGNGKFHMRV